MSSESEAKYICLSVPFCMLYHAGPYSSLPRGDGVGAEATATAAAVAAALL